MAIDTRDKRHQALFVFPVPDSAVDNDDRTLLLPLFRIGDIAEPVVVVGATLLIYLRTIEDQMVDIRVVEDQDIGVRVTEDQMIDIRTY